jgi:hypothetical protein
MTLLPELRRDLAERVRADVRARRRRRVRLWLCATVPVSLAAGTAGALAAGGVLQIGAADPDPVEDRRPNARDGVVLPGTVRLLAVRAPDPEGGPAWGLRISQTTRGLGCLLAGRVVDERVGALGDRDVLHPFARAATGRGADCGALDLNGRLFYNVFAERVHASARLAATCRPSTEPASDMRRCDARAERDLFYGTLGPDAESVTYSAPGGSRTVPTVGPEGAYLVVTPSTRSSLTATGGYAWPVNGPITEVRFRDGSRCVLRDGAPVDAAACEPPGFRPRRTPPERAQVRAPVSASAARRGNSWVVTVRFRARVAVADASSAYNIRIRSSGASRGKGALAIIDRNVRQGEVVTYRFKHRQAGAVHSGTVTFHRAKLPGQVPAGPDGVQVGRFSVRVP